MACVKDGRCLKWTLEQGNMLCWIKGRGGTREDGIAGMISGTYARGTVI